jgi:uncharacterized spore protein YtfJ
MNAQQVLSGAQDVLTARRVFGDPIERDGSVVLPVAVVGGGGGGGGRTDQEGAGFGLKARPAGVFVLRDGDAKWRPALDLNKVIIGGQIVALAAVLTFGRLATKWLAGRA